MLDLLHRHIDGKGKQAKLKSPNELQVGRSFSQCPPMHLPLHLQHKLILWQAMLAQLQMPETILQFA